MAVKSVFDLIGDFYQAHLNGNAEAKNAALVKIEEDVTKNRTADSAFADYYNDVFSGRTGFNAKLSLSDYPKESIIRELFQNTLGCRYLTGDIKIVVDFQENDVVTISYNEVGFSMEDILYYLGFGMNNGDETREGRFGIGAKSVFLNVLSLSIRSNTFSFKIRNDDGKLTVESINLNTAPFKGTKVILELDHGEYERIKDNFLTITEKKGDYLNMVELCFAFNRKHLMNNALSLDDSSTKTVNVAVAQNNQVSDVYRIALHCKDENDIPKIRFYHNNKSLLDFLHYERDGFVYLIPFAVANAKRENVVKLLLAKYNYFSTYELTGYIGTNNDRFIDEKLSAFFVSVPNTCITHSRTGIRHDKESLVTKALERDIPEILREYRKYFVLDLKQIKDTGYYYMAPRSYAFEFFNSFMKTSRYAANVKDVFVSGISFQFPQEAAPVTYDQLKSTGFKSLAKDVSEERKRDGTANKEYIELRLEKLRSGLTEFKEKTLYAGYEWENGDGSEKGRVYRYEFIRGENTYTISSEHSGGFSDFELYNGFPSVIGYYLPTFLVEDCVMDEIALEKIFTLFDDSAGEDYSLSMKYYRIHFDRGDENYSFEISKIKVLNIKNAMETLGRRRHRFSSSQNYQEVTAMLVNSFTQGKNAMTFLREIKDQGGSIELVLDFNKKYRFQVYGKQFMIPSSITDMDLLEILGDSKQMIESGVLNGRKFDFPYDKSVYTFDVNEISELLKDYSSKEATAKIFAEMYVCNLKYDGVVFLNEEGKVLFYKHFGEPISEEEKNKAARFVVLRDDLNKAEFASTAEYIIAGEDKGILNRFFSRTKDPNRIIPDQISLKYKRAPVLSREEFEFAAELYNFIKDKSELQNYKSYFAKDINNRLYGYGTCCGYCGESGHNINGYDLVDFSVDIMTEEGEKRFNFALYLCENHIADSNGWFIKELSVGGMEPFMWLKEISEAESLPPEFFICSVKYIPHIIYDITPEGYGRNAEVVSAEERTLEFRLTPLMAAKWVEDNKGEQA
ncbi:MAG: hypothetical protein HDT46_10830 [Ruminococcaceae bacterium]|nr:hypothetical protein [Oscillospiraceae bacterium]